ncbi:amino acid-binding protein [Nocardioides cynanchi]|uniref:amino acid-binding protein n=1 Tax=Nocardioides cynanchi TaxID=2558918 RepID=UPI001244F231|nr:amino acid-binding protein [Nocardioides cynanchi]
MLLLRVELPNVPGSLGRLASAIGAAGGDIDAIEIVEKRHDGTAVDDVLLEMVGGAMPDSVVSACTAVEGVRVLWISRYLAGGNLFLDLEVVESLTGEPATALDRLVELLPVAFRCEWAARAKLGPDGSTVELASEGAPADLSLRPGSGLDRQTIGDDLVAVAPVGHKRVVAIGRRGGPEFLDSELARFGHLVALAASIARAAR